jgi:putative transposase
MVKLKSKKRVIRCFRAYKRGVSQKFMAKKLNISTRWFRKLYRQWEKTGDLDLCYKKLGRPRKMLSDEHRNLIIQTYEEYRLNAVYLEKVIYAEHGVRIPHNAIHKVLLEEGFAKREPNKSKRRKPWIRYERTHSLSAGHLDWYEPSDGPKVCAVLDDASRKILAGGEFLNATAANSIGLVQQVIDEYGHIRILRESITDHGTQFCSNKKDPSSHRFEDFLKQNKIKHILCRVKHPQSNGKIEKWFHTYSIHRPRFNSFHEFSHWYNNRPHGALRLRHAETPEQAFWRKLPKEYYFGIAVKYLGW